MLIDPESGSTYIPTPSYFLGCFDIYDREETLGVELERFDPNPVDRERLILTYCLPIKRSYRQRYSLYKCIELSLEDPNYDFQALLENDPEALWVVLNPVGSGLDGVAVSGFPVEKR